MAGAVISPSCSSPKGAYFMGSRGLHYRVPRESDSQEYTK